MKRILVVLICLIFALSLTACSGTSSDTPVVSDNNDISADAPNTSDTADAEPADTDIATEDNTETGDNNNDVAEGSDDTAVISFVPVTAVDNEQCSITITDIDPDNMWGYTLKATFENKSSDKNYMFSVYSAHINGVYCDPFFASEVAPGKKSVEEISFSTDTLEENGIVDFTDIEITFHVSDYDDWTADLIADETVHVYPYGEDKATTFVREPQATDTILADNEYVTVIITDYYNDDIWGYTANMFIVNKTDKELMVSVENASVNGYMADPFFADSVMPGKCTFTSMSWSTDTFAEIGVTDVEEIEFTLVVYDWNDWMSDRFVNETIILNP